MSGDPISGSDRPATAPGYPVLERVTATVRESGTDQLVILDTILKPARKPTY